jgi:hypothetical protein
LNAQSLPHPSQWSTPRKQKRIFIVKQLDGKTPLRTFLYKCSLEQQYKGKLWALPIEATTSYTVGQPKIEPWRVLLQPLDPNTVAVLYRLKIVRTIENYGEVKSQSVPLPGKTGETWQENLSVEMSFDSLPANTSPVVLREVEDVAANEAKPLSLVPTQNYKPQGPVAIGTTLVELETNQKWPQGWGDDVPGRQKCDRKISAVRYKAVS